MAEVFRGKNHTVYTTNNGGKELLNCLIYISFKTQKNRNMVVVRRYLTEIIAKGFGSFSLDTEYDFPDIFKDVDNLKCLLFLVEQVANELSKPQPELNWDIKWNRNTRLRWLAKTTELYEIISELLIDNGLIIGKLNVCLVPKDNIIYNYHLNSNYYKELCKRNLKQKDRFPFEQRKLRLLNKLISILEFLEEKKEELYLRRYERSEVLISQGMIEKALDDLHILLQQTNDEKERQLLRESIEELLKR